MASHQLIDSPQGLTFVYADPGTVPEGEFHDWYENEHLPPRLAIDGILSSSRYKAIDSKSPTWLTLYDMTSTAVVETPEYRALIPNASQREKEIMANLGHINRRLYSLLLSLLKTNTDVPSLPGPYLLVVHVKVTLDGEEEFNRWYNQEHMVLISQVRGWLAGRRYKLLDSVSRGTRIKLGEDEPPSADYVAIHDMASNDFMELPEYKAAIQTPWREKVTQQAVIQREVRLFERYKIYKSMS